MLVKRKKLSTTGIFLVVVVFNFILAVEAWANLDQNYFRFYVNEDAQTPTDPWPAGATDLTENENISSTDGVVDGDILRLRLSLNSSGFLSESGQEFILQYKEIPCTSGTWTDVAAQGSGAIWRGYDNSTPTDSSTLSTLLLSVSDVKESYEEENNGGMPNSIATGDDGEWDWVVENNGAAQGTTYCFRAIRDALLGPEPLNSYNRYPQATTKEFAPESHNWRWYSDADNETPTNNLAVENTAPIGVFKNEAHKLRLTINDASGAGAIDTKFKIQFSTASDFSSNVNDVVESGSCADASIWCYADGVDADDDAITSLLLSDSDTKGVHNESGTSTTTFDHPQSSAVEYEFTIKSTTDATGGGVYYFRAFDTDSGSAVPIGTGETYPQAKITGPTLNFSVAGVNADVTIDGYTTDAASTATTIPFGVLSPYVPKTLAQRLTVTSDGPAGYTIYLAADGQFRTNGGEEVSPISGTNAAPSAWNFIVGQNTTGAFGYHPDDDVLSGSSTRFQDNDTWAQVETSRKEIIHTPSTAETDVHDILYRAEASAIQPGGSYSNELVYIVVPTW